MKLPLLQDAQFSQREGGISPEVRLFLPVGLTPFDAWFFDSWFPPILCSAAANE
jgi:hypothetical protein